MAHPGVAAPEETVPPERERPRRGRWLAPAGPLAAAAALMALGMALRAPIARYAGPPNQRAFNDFILREVGAYSDIASLYFRDQLWRRPVPYVDYPLEYPVGIGALSWLVSLATSGVTAYFLATAAVMAAAGLGTVALLRWARGSNPWLLALWPGLPLYVALNWDLLALLPTVAALLLLQRGRVGWSAALLAAATWIKFFPIVLAPLALLALLLERRWRAALGFVALFGAASVAINAPFALRLSPGVGLRDGWLYFFRFNQDRPPDPWLSNLWDVLGGLGLRLTVAEINRATTLLLALGLVALGGLLWWSAARRAHPPRAALLPAAVAAIGWFLLVNKVYSPQYSLWLAALLALTAAPLPLAVAFAAADLAAFAGSFTLLYLLAAGSTATSDWFYAEVEWGITALREAVIAAIVTWAAWRVVRAGGETREGRSAG